MNCENAKYVFQVIIQTKEPHCQQIIDPHGKWIKIM